MLAGKLSCDQRSFSIALNELKQSLKNIESHLKLRNFLVGHGITLADALLVSIMAGACEAVLDKKTRDTLIPNLARYSTLILQMQPFTRVFGTVIFVKNLK